MNPHFSRRNTWSFIAVVWLVISLINPVRTIVDPAARSDDVIKETHVCFNAPLEISCDDYNNGGDVSGILVFDTARYGRNDTRLAVFCDVPYSWNCDVDVQFLLNRACAGRSTCSLEVGVATFTDPCGYSEFLKLTYRCVPAAAVNSGCLESHQSGQPVLYDHGYLSSPNYPDRYFTGAECSWTLAVRRWQTIRITLFDFELDVKRAGECHDYVDISGGSGTRTAHKSTSALDTVDDGVAKADGRSLEKIVDGHHDGFYFRECGAMGRQVVDVEDSVAIVSFVSSQTSSTQRGFFLYFEARGPGCLDLPDPRHGRILYFMDGDILRANATCYEGFRFVDIPSGIDSMTSSSKPLEPTPSVPAENYQFRHITCSGYFWSESVPDCKEVSATTPMTSPESWSTAPNSSPQTDVGLLVSTDSSSSNRLVSSISMSYVGITLGAVSALLVVALMLLAATCCFRWRSELRRQTAADGDKMDDEWRVVVNNLQSSPVAGQHSRRHPQSQCPTISTRVGNKQQPQEACSISKYADLLHSTTNLPAWFAKPRPLYHKYSSSSINCSLPPPGGESSFDSDVFPYIAVNGGCGNQLPLYHYAPTTMASISGSNYRSQFHQHSHRVTRNDNEDAWVAKSLLRSSALNHHHHGDSGNNNDDDIIISALSDASSDECGNDVMENTATGDVIPAGENSTREISTSTKFAASGYLLRMTPHICESTKNRRTATTCQIDKCPVPADQIRPDR